MLPGIESWYDYGNKSKTSRNTGMAKVRRSPTTSTASSLHSRSCRPTSLGLDCDSGADRSNSPSSFSTSPGAYPAFSLFTCYGRASPLNLELQRAGRVLPIPFPFLDGNGTP